MAGELFDSYGRPRRAKAIDPVFDPYTGAVAMASETAPGKKFRLLAIRLHFTLAPTTSQDFTVTLDSGDGTAYDTVLFRRDPSVGSVTDLLIPFGGDEHIFEADDVIDCAYTNTDTRTYGLVVIYELI